jgi:hypothetical protein
MGNATGRSLVQRVLPIVYRIKNWKSHQGPTKGLEEIIIIILFPVVSIVLNNSAKGKKDGEF